jgi:hypothetical protein
MPDWELSARLLAGKGLSHSLERAICLNLSLKRGVYHGAGGRRQACWVARSPDDPDARADPHPTARVTAHLIEFLPRLGHHRDAADFGRSTAAATSRPSRAGSRSASWHGVASLPAQGHVRQVAKDSESALGRRRTCCVGRAGTDSGERAAITFGLLSRLWRIRRGFPPWFRLGGRFRYGHSEAGQSAVSQTAEFWWVPLATKPASARTATMPKITVRVRMVFMV